MGPQTATEYATPGHDNTETKALHRHTAMHPRIHARTHARMHTRTLTTPLPLQPAMRCSVSLGCMRGLRPRAQLAYASSSRVRSDACGSSGWGRGRGKGDGRKREWGEKLGRAVEGEGHGRAGGRGTGPHMTGGGYTDRPGEQAPSTSQHGLSDPACRAFTQLQAIARSPMKRLIAHHRTTHQSQKTQSPNYARERTTVSGLRCSGRRCVSRYSVNSPRCPSRSLSLNVLRASRRFCAACSATAAASRSVPPSAPAASKSRPLSFRPAASGVPLLPLPPAAPLSAPPAAAPARDAALPAAPAAAPLPPLHDELGLAAEDEDDETPALLRDPAAAADEGRNPGLVERAAPAPPPKPEPLWAPVERPALTDGPPDTIRTPWDDPGG